MSKSIEVKQNGFKDCAPSCLLSLIRYYGSDASHEELTMLLKTDINGTNAYNLINGAKSIGFDGYGIKYTYDDIVNNTISFPIITHVLKNNMYHFIVIYEVNINKKTLYVMDPEIGYTKIKFEYFKKIYLETSIVLYPVKKLKEFNKTKNIFKYILEYLLLEKKNTIAILIMSFFVIVLSIICNFYLKIIIDKLLINYFYKELLIVSFLFLNIMLLKSFLTLLRNKYLIRVTNNVEIKMNNETIRHIFNLPYQFFKNKSTGDILSRVSDLKGFKDILSNIIVNISMDLILVIISTITLLLINKELFVITFISMIIYFLIVIIYSNTFKKEIDNLQISNGEYNKSLNESIEGYESNKNINVINYVCKKLEMKYIIYVKKNYKYENSVINQSFIKDIVMNICYIITIFYGTILINDNVLSVGNFIVFNSLLLYFTEPIKNILDLEPNLNYIKGVINRINDLILMQSKSVLETDKMISGDIIINNLTYSYNNINNTISNVNLYIKYGSKILIHGNSGNGKSTLLKILLKYLDDYKGTIKINNINLLDIDESLISSSFTYVSQNNYLINDTLKNNIIFDRNVNDDEYEKVINICHVNNIRDSKAMRDNFIIEDNGFNISGGERQKIILARALLKKSNYIILDEALSEIGFIEEKEILNKIINYYVDKTIIYVSHKKEIIDLFNEKYYLERRKAC